MTDSLLDRERDKYRRMWQRREYRLWAPGEDVAELAMSSLGATSGDRVIDFGCGTGRPALRLQQLGMRVLAIDFADNCLDPGIDLEQFVVAPIWNPLPVMAEWGFCTDVMEHIPPERVDQTLDAIRAATERGAFFRIDFGPDVSGRLIGEALHLSVHAPEWWEEKLARRWRSVRRVKTHCFICRS